MRILFLKEVRAFFSSFIGYIVMIVFVVINSLFLWIFPGDSNILDGGFATLDSFFMMAPWVFLFLVPAVTMRLFSEEKRGGTMELLFTKPISDLQIVLAKYFAGLVLVLFSLIPCLVFYWSVSVLGNPPGNLDTGGTWGAFLGLFFLAAIYVAAGVFASAMTENQIISFIFAVIMCFLLYMGFDYLSDLPVLNHFDAFILNLGINEHYKSISRGVIDSRDIIYYGIVIILFVLITKIKLQSRNW